MPDPTSHPVLEVAANSVASAEAAQSGGAARVELCAALEIGGITPSEGVIALARDKLRIALYVLIRPRAGDFVYTHGEVDTMRRDVEACVRLGCDGVVIGALEPRGDIDKSICADLIEAAGPLGVTFHRAFDLSRDQRQALEDVTALGCERILTSGGAPDAVGGAPRIARLIQQADGRIIVMPGAGVRSGNIANLARETGATEFHASAKRALPTRFTAGTTLQGMDAGELRTDEAEVRAMASALARIDRTRQPI